MTDFAEYLHRANANRGLGAAKAAARLLAAKATWTCPRREAEAKALYAQLTGRTMASHYAAKNKETNPNG